jgi:hypothetical protein
LKALLFIILMTLPCAAAELNTRQQALAYVQALPADTKLYVQPTRLQRYEIVGDGDAQLIAGIVSDFNARHPPYRLIAALFPTPLLSVFAYYGDRPNDLQQFQVQSRLPQGYKRVVASLQMDYQACVFTSFLDRDTWAVGGVIFVDQARLVTASQQRECVEAGLDYIDGFPALTPVDFRQFPPEDVRALIVDALLTCSTDGQSEQTDPDRTKDGLTPLPKRVCVIGQLGK